MRPRNEEFGGARPTHCVIFIIIALIIGCANFGFAWYTIFASFSIGFTLGYISFFVQEWFDYFVDGMAED